MRSHRYHQMDGKVPTSQNSKAGRENVNHFLGRKGNTGFNLTVPVCLSSPCPSLSGHLSGLWSSGTDVTGLF